MGRERSRFQEDKEANLQQIDRNIIAAKKKYEELLTQITTLEDNKKHLNEYLLNITAIKNQELQDKIKNNETNEQVLKSLTEDFHKKIAELYKQKNEFKEFKEIESQRIKAITSNLEERKEDLDNKQSSLENKEHDFTVKVLRFKDDSIIFDKAKRDLEELKSSVEKEAQKNRIRALELDDRENIVDKEMSNTESLSKYLKGFEYKLKKREKELIIAADCLEKNKEALESERNRIESIANKNDKDLQDLVVARKKILLDSQKVKEFEKELRNRESRLNEKENIINAKIGG